MNKKTKITAFQKIIINGRKYTTPAEKRQLSKANNQIRDTFLLLMLHI